MTAAELMQYQVDQVEKQLRICLDGMAEATYDAPCAPGGMTPRDMLEHLGEAYSAFATHLKGGKHAWGEFSIADKSTGPLRDEVFRLRREAVDLAMARDDEAIKLAYDYIVGHDNYHVAEFCLARMQADSSWDPYSIYS